MSDKSITLSLGGQERVLDFGGFWFTKHYQRIVKNKGDLTDAENLEAYIIAALKAPYSLQRKKEDFTIQDVENWLGDMTNAEMLELEKKIVPFLLPDEPGELEAPEAGA
jgi:hypothetical protein